MEGCALTLLSPQSISPKGRWRQHLVRASVVYSGIYLRGVSEVFQSVKNCLSKAMVQEACWRWHVLGRAVGTQSCREINGFIMRHTNPCLLAFPPESNISVNWFGPSAGCLAFCGRMSPLCTQAERLPTKASIAMFERLGLLLNESISRGWSCEQDVLSTARRAPDGSPRETFRLTYLLCWQSPISRTQL